MGWFIDVDSAQKHLNGLLHGGLDNLEQKLSSRKMSHGVMLPNISPRNSSCRYAIAFAIVIHVEKQSDPEQLERGPEDRSRHLQVQEDETTLPFVQYNTKYMYLSIVQELDKRATYPSIEWGRLATACTRRGPPAALPHAEPGKGGAVRWWSSPVPRLAKEAVAVGAVPHAEAGGGDRPSHGSGDSALPSRRSDGPSPVIERPRLCLPSPATTTMIGGDSGWSKRRAAATGACGRRVVWTTRKKETHDSDLVSSPASGLELASAP
uniref:Uncharacterized protein n=1 Tax=Oryza punctata TaxID=4537 RepID=A0A0E0M5E8_ORYPU